MTAPLDFGRTQAIQWEASDPAASAWVVANAGSGKTHVLTQRVIRLLLAGADPSALLCLTFTKVAAAEMSRRIFEQLGAWATAPEAELRAALAALQGRPAAATELSQARRLFARALETPGGLKIQTIHAFCERLLHQFPFEANVPGQFTILDDTASAALLAAARAEVMNAAARQPQARLGRAIRYLAEHATDAGISEALDGVIAKRDAIRTWMDAAADGGAGTIDDSLADLRERLGLQPGETEDAICREICRSAKWPHADCAAFAAELEAALSLAPHTGNALARARIEAVLAGAGHVPEAAARLQFFLHTDSDGGWRIFDAGHRFKSHRFGAEFGRAKPHRLDAFEAESARLLGLAEKHRAARNYDATEALLVVGEAILQFYHAAKKRSGQLDFSDLIAKTRNLLARGEAAAWVLYKLDARIEHILVDEAQDTSPGQWAVVQAIAADFFAGEAARGRRTIFAVGDDKQSIFGFQGAAPHMLADMEQFFRRAAENARAGFVRRPLALSFRSTTEVLDGVDKIFRGDLEDKVTASGYEAHTAKRRDEPGRIVVMPRIVRRKVEAPDDWTEPFDAPTAAEVELADQVAGEIAALCGTRLPSGKRVAEGDILILVRRRDAFVWAMNRALRERRIVTAGADRVPVASHIAALDCLALIDAVLLPEDDLQLAACLKSPLFGLSEDALFRLAGGRTRSLFATLRDAVEPELRAAAARLAGWRAMADQVTPFQFLATVLGPDGGRRAFRQRLGREADDVLDALLSQSLSYEALEPPSLQGFLRFIRASRGDIKREAEQASGGVRIMTVHGAKGLEADVVFLVDTGGLIVAHQHRDVLIEIADQRRGPAYLWRRPKPEATPLQAAADAAADEATRREYLRLLYVGMTRARDVLYVCGIRAEKPRSDDDDCWYSLAANALVPNAVERDAATGELVARFEWPQPPRPARGGAPASAAAIDPAGQAAPDWLFRPAPSPAPAPRPLRPSRALAEPDPHLASDFGGSGAGAALRRGRLVHMLLQALAGRSDAERATLAAKILRRELPGDPALGDEIGREAEAVLTHPALRDAFGPGSRAELPILGSVATPGGAYVVSGRIDRLVREAAGWRILDFKTNRAAPASVADADPAYILQLALYARLLSDMEPGAEVHATLVWTAAPNVMPVPAALLARALASLGIDAKPFP